MMKLKTNKFFKKGLRKKRLEVKRMRIKLENIIFSNLKLSDKIENKSKNFKMF